MTSSCVSNIIFKARSHADAEVIDRPAKYITYCYVIDDVTKNLKILSMIIVEILLQASCTYANYFCVIMFSCHVLCFATKPAKNIAALTKDSQIYCIFSENINHLMVFIRNIAIFITIIAVMRSSCIKCYDKTGQ